MELIDPVNSVYFWLFQMTWLRWSTFLLRSLTVTHNPPLLSLFLPSNASIFTTMVFSPWGNTDHVVVTASIDLPSSSQWDAQFHCIAYDYSHADGDGL